jgi:tight adherence protein C
VDDGDVYRAELSQPLLARLLGPAWEVFDRFARAATPSFWLDRMRRNAMLAGLGRWGLEGVFALKATFALGIALLAVVVATLGGAPLAGLVWAIIGGVVGFLLPDVWIARRASARQDEIRRALPETLDLMAVAVEAGMGLEGAIELVAQKLPGSLGEELHRMLHEIQLGTSRREALHNLRDRTEVSELSAFALALAQADTIGSPLAEVLRVQAGEMRTLRRIRAREQAAKVPVKLLFPLLIGIFPALAIIVVGPAAVAIMDAFGG